MAHKDDEQMQGHQIGPFEGLLKIDIAISETGKSA
jgi:hypothetical protein